MTAAKEPQTSPSDGVEDASTEARADAGSSLQRLLREKALPALLVLGALVAYADLKGELRALSERLARLEGQGTPSGTLAAPRGTASPPDVEPAAAATPDVESPAEETDVESPAAEPDVAPDMPCFHHKSLSPLDCGATAQCRLPAQFPPRVARRIVARLGTDRVQLCEPAP